MDQIWSHYLAQRHAAGFKRDPKLTRARRAKIRSRLATFEPHDLRVAIGVLLAEGSWWVANRFAGPDYWLRSDEQVEKLLEKAEAAEVDDRPRTPPPADYAERIARHQAELIARAGGRERLEVVRAEIEAGARESEDAATTLARLEAIAAEIEASA